MASISSTSSSCEVISSSRWGGSRGVLERCDGTPRGVFDRDDRLVGMVTVTAGNCLPDNGRLHTAHTQRRFRTAEVSSATSRSQGNRLVPKRITWPLFRGHLRSWPPLRHIRHWISRKPLGRLGCKGPPIGNGVWGIKWGIGQVNPKGQTCDPNMLREQYLENRCYLRTIANYQIVCCEAVELAILVTAWLLVDF